jgi:hypothetical protein
VCVCVCVIGKAKAAELQLVFVNESLVCWKGWKEGRMGREEDV